MSDAAKESVKKTLQLPIIPPLPSSFDKENVKGFQAASGKNSQNSLSRTAPFRRNNNISRPLHKGEMPSKRLGQPKPSPDPNSREVLYSPSLVSQSSSLGRKRRVLRYSETVETFFCLSQDTPQEHRQLCKEIADGPLADDASAWRRALQFASSTLKRGPPKSISASNVHSTEDIVRLHRRATSRFMVVPDGDKTPLEAHDDILSIWLSYANIQKKYTSKADARSTYRHIHNQNIGSKLAASYVEFATFERVEGNAQKSIQILQNGITNKAQPTRDLEYLMQELQEETIRAPKKSEIEDGGRATHVPTTRKRKDAAQKASPKRSKTEQGAVEMKNSYRESKHSAHSSSKETDQVGKKDDGTRRYIRIQRSPRGSTLYKAKTDDASKATEGQERGRPRPLRGKVTALGSKTPRLARVGLTGKPQRVDPTRPLEVEDGSDADNADDTPMKDKQESMRQETSQLCPKLTRMDLSYMMNWDPTKRETPKFPKPKGPPKTSTTSSEDKDGIGGGSASGGSASGGSVSAVTLSSHSNGSHLSDQRASVHSGDSYHSIRTLGSEREKQSVDSSSSRHSVVSPHTATMLSQLNSDFLPLVHENNILRVNAAPYVKLGVIGKGGSCKVYRALSRDCAVLAIKKVKLGHLDEKAVNGYANEIALLKRLQGNPAIIQMYDSEVDIERKAIFVVMELGEVDLNHVLQQQVLLNVNESNGCRSKLNMNFIRLTWQQMLSAVHCIHEERIIHGDLKPANFLFVRGCLKLIDFGIAKAIQSDDTTNIYRDSQIGTLNYMSPEAILDTGSGSGRARMKIGRASDIWSLGCILYQMVYGRTPFADLHMIQKLQAIVNPKHKIAFPQSADEDAVDAMKRCLQRKPDDRPPIVGNGGLLNEHCFLRSTKSA